MIESASYVLWGSAGLAKVLNSLIALRGGRVIALFENNPLAEPVLTGVPLHIGFSGFEKWILHQPAPHTLRGLAAIGGARGKDRLSIHECFRSHGLLIESIIHPQASVCATAVLGAGTQVLAQAVVAADARVGEGCILNHCSGVDHECMLGDGVHVAPGATLCGCVVLGRNVMIGAGAVVLPRVTVGENTIVGAGAVVTRDLPADVVAIGNPAKVIRAL
jgi:sugar O-acyltransferase (sialic acid O-acetyltransferase NeuD family)